MMSFEALNTGIDEHQPCYTLNSCVLELKEYRIEAIWDVFRNLWL